MEAPPCTFCFPARCFLRLLLLSRVLLSSSLQVICTLVAAFLHFFFLSSFCWVLTEAWQSYMAVTGRLRNRIIRKRFLCLGWGEDAGSEKKLSMLSGVSSRAEMVKDSISKSIKSCHTKVMSQEWLSFQRECWGGFSCVWVSFLLSLSPSMCNPELSKF